MQLSAIVLPDRHPPAAFLADVVAAERAGLDTVWTYDHLSWPRLRSGPWFGSVPLLAAAAAATTTVRLGLQVATPNFRHPVPFAKELMTLDQLSDGRIELGVGAGTEGPDATVLGDEPLSRRDRTERFAEWVGLLDRLLREDVTDHQGRWYRAVQAHQQPGCVQRPRLPFTVAAAGPKGLALAVEQGRGWVTYGPYGALVTGEDEWVAAVADQSAGLDAALDRAGRPRDAVHRIVQIGLETTWPFASASRYADLTGRLSEAGIDEVSIHWPRPDGLGVPAEALAVVLGAHPRS